MKTKITYNAQTITSTGYGRARVRRALHQAEWYGIEHAVRETGIPEWKIRDWCRQAHVNPDFPEYPYPITEKKEVTHESAD